MHTLQGIVCFLIDERFVSISTSGLASSTLFAISLQVYLWCRTDASFDSFRAICNCEGSWSCCKGVSLHALCFILFLYVLQRLNILCEGEPNAMMAGMYGLS